MNTTSRILKRFPSLNDGSFAIEKGLKLVLVVFGMVVWGSGFGQVVEWDLDTDATPTIIDPNVSATNFNSSGTGTIIFSASGARANDWPTGGLSTSDYFEISVSPTVGFNLNISDLNFSERRSGTGIRDYQVRYSTDGFSSFTTISTANVPDNTSERDGSISGLNIDVLDGETLIFRFYGYNAEATGGTWRIGDGTLNIDGTTSASSSNTTVQFSSATYSQNETSTSVDLCVDITNEDAVATSVDVVLTSGAGTYLSTFTQTLTFPSNSSATQCATITWMNNGTCDGNETYTFTLQNESGGNAVSIGSQGTTVLAISDDEQFSGTIAFQGFEGSGWAFTNTPATYNVSDDIWDVVSFIELIVPSEGLSFWGLRDLDNGNGGGSFDHELELSDFPISAYSSVSIEFDYHTVGFDSGDDIQYQIALDGGAYGSSIGLLKNTGSWITETIAIPDGSTSVRLKLIGNQNGADDYAGFDNIKLIGIGCITCIEPTTEAVFDLNTPTFLTETGATLDWTGGDGDYNLVVLRENIAISTNPVDGTTYNPNPAFGTGDDIGTNEFTVYTGIAETVTVTNLTPGTEYFSKIFEYNCLPGNEDYFVSGTPDTDVFITPPENPATFDEGCVGPTSIDLSWTAPANGNYDGYLLVVREGASPHAVTSLDPSSQTFNLNYSSAPTYGTGGPLSRVLYRGVGLSATVTNLTAGVNYTFEVFAYTIGSVSHRYSAGTSTSQTIELENVNTLSATPAATSVALSWIIDISCIDEIIIVAFDGGAVSNNPSGSGYTVNSNSYTDVSNPTLAGGEKVVYSGLGSLVNITNLITDTEYCFKVFVRLGSVWSSGVELCETPRTTTVLEPGDLSIISVVTNTGGGDDEVCFVAYQSITTNTAIDFTDNGFERLTSGLWADSEGVIRMERTGGTIAAGTPICFAGQGNSGSDFDVYVCGVLDAGWNVSSLNGSSQFNMNANDQIWIMQNGSWSNPSGDHNSTYTGSVLYGWTAIGWEAAPGYDNTAGSTLFPNSSCLNTDLQTLNNDIVKYDGPTSTATKIEWITRINDDSNWASYATYADYNANTPHYLTTCVNFDITAGIYTDGLWTGDTSTDWFDCTNWASLRLPENNINVEIPVVTNYPIISAAGAESNDITINTGGLLTIDNALSELEINGDLIIEGTLTNSNGNVAFVGNVDQNITDNDIGIGSISFYDFEINKHSGLLITSENIAISSTLTLTDGILELDPITNTVILPQGIIVNGGSNESHIDGFVSKSGDEDFRFPVGDSSYYQPIEIFELSLTSTFRAKYIKDAHPDAGPYYDGQTGGNGFLEEIGHCDYWTLNRTSGSASAKVILTYGETPCNVITDVNFLNMAKWDGTFWEYPVIGVDPISVPGEISSTIAFPTFSDFVIASTGGALINVLPITLTYFDVKALSATVMTDWETSTETNNDYFTIERSADAAYFEEIARIDGAGTSHEANQYSFEDLKPFPGISYYRLKQTDFDGVFTYSDIRSVEFDVSDKFQLINAYRSESDLNLVYRTTAPYLLVEIFDVTGQRVFADLIENYGSYSTIQPFLQRGAYVVRLSHGSESQSRKFIW